MAINNSLKERLIEKVQDLSAEQIEQVESFIDALKAENREQNLTVVSAQLSELVFARVWDNPEDADYDQL